MQAGARHPAGEDDSEQAGRHDTANVAAGLEETSRGAHLAACGSLKQQRLQAQVQQAIGQPEHGHNDHDAGQRCDRL